MSFPASPTDVVTMVACNECGHQVPEDNLAIHQAHACGGRARRASAPEEEQGMRQRRRATTTRQEASDNNNDRAKQSQPEQVINLIDDDEEEEVQVLEPPASVNQWSCPRCTLLNPNTDSSCSACQYHKHGGTRTPDATRRERLVPQQAQAQAPPSPGQYVGGGALLGGVLGAAGAAMRGESWVGGALEGVVSGAVGGAVLGSTAVAQQEQSRRRNHYHHARMQPRSSMRVHRSNSGNHTTTTIYAPNGRVSQHQVAAAGGDPMLGFLMAHHGMQQQQQQQGGMNIDNMTYEQLLERFGDGSEHRGADEHVISSLPVSKVTQKVSKEHADEDYNTCSICLEQFQMGDERKTLPCLHGFHHACVDKWLRTNASCPICKHVVSS